MFRVRAVDGRGIQSEEATLRVAVTPPWWQTWLAYTIYGLTLIGCIVAVDRFQRRRLIRREREQAALREQELERKQARQLKVAYDALEASMQHLTRTQDQLIQSEKMASLGQLTAGIAHEIKNPLNFVNNFAEINQDLVDELKEELRANPDLRVADVEELLDDLVQNARVINQHGKRADGIVKSMMEHATGGTGRREATDVNALVSDYVDLACHSKQASIQEPRVEIRRDLAGDLEPVIMISQELGRVLLNLLGNAFDAVHERASSANGVYRPEVRVTTRKVGGEVEIRVTDNGIGIPHAVRDKIFEPFFTTKPTGSGTGLGLSLAYDIVTQGHGGRLEVESTEGEGATFVITLPQSTTSAGD
jgi:signal transduction histidine kinase